MTTPPAKLLLEDETESIISCAFEVLNTLGHGLLEKPYENALTVEFRLRGIPFRQQPSFPITYKSAPIGVYIPDLIAYDSVIVETKTVDKIGDLEIGQAVNYLKITGLGVALILNFKRPKLSWKRVIL